MATTLKELIGKTVLVGITHVDSKGRKLGNSQYFGTVVKADPKEGVILARHGVQDFSPLPPFPEQYIPAKKGIYTLQSNGMKIKDPDYTCTWRLKSSPIETE